jgi:uncharacterized protein (TIGR02284 family)
MQTQRTIQMLNRLIGMCRDAEELCPAAARVALSADLAALLRSRAGEWARRGDELQALVLLLGGVPVTSASAAAHTQRIRLALRRLLLGASDAAALAALSEVHCGARAHYEKTLAGYLPARIRRTLALQAARMTDRCAEIGIGPSPRALHV